MLPSTSSREALLVCLPFPPWNLPSLTVEFTLSSPCSRSDPCLSCQGAALANLDFFFPHDLVLWTDALFLFLLVKMAPAFLPTALSVALRPLFPFLAGPLCSSFSAEACAILVLAAPTSLPLLHLSDSCSVLATLSSPPSLLLPQTLWQIWQELSSLSSCSTRLQWVPRHLFLPGNNAADELARQGALLVPSAIPCSLSPLIFCIYSSLFLDWRRSVSSKFFDTPIPSISTEELALLRHAHYVLSHLRCNEHSLLLGYLSRIGRIENPSCSACEHSSQDISDLLLHCPAMDSLCRSLFGDSLSLYDLWSRPWGVVWLLGLHGLLPCPIPWKGLGNQQQQQW